ncbi:hypothetical protein EPO15_10875 [bacterium]|nr:MAG: hypothetical protein EPO15_10875 [bacterium]
MKKTLAVGLVAALILPSGATPALAQHFVRAAAPSAPLSAPVRLGGAPTAAAPLSRPSLTAPSLAPTLTVAPSPVLPTAHAAAAAAVAAPVAPVAAVAAPLPNPLPQAGEGRVRVVAAAALTERLVSNEQLAALTAPNASANPAAQGVALDRLFELSARTEQNAACPFGFDKRSTPKEAGLQAPVPSGPTAPGTTEDQFRPRSSRVGVGPVKYVWWNTFYHVMQWFNVTLARDPNRKVSWDKWPTPLGLMYLLAKIRYVRSGTLTDPYDYAANDTEKPGKEPEQAKTGYTADGKWVLDRENPQMGAKDTRFGSNIPPQKVRPDVENMTPSARDAGKLRWRLLNDAGKTVLKPALILNDLAGGWIQFQFHGFGGNTKREPVTDNPHRLPRSPNDPWPAKEALVDRTSKDHTRVTDDGRPTVMNERVQAWIQAQIYGTTQEEQDALRSHAGGKMRLGPDGRLPEDPKKPGIDQTGFNNNYNPQLSFLHWLWTVEHNAIADHYRKFNPGWDDQTLFLMAQKVNVALIARTHTIQWTEDLLQHPTLQAGMHADWYGFLGPRLKPWLMRMQYRYPLVRTLTKWVTDNDTISGMPGSKWEHHDGPFQVPKQFRMVYRLHEMVLDEHEILDPTTGRTLDRIGLIDFIQSNTRAQVARFGYDVLGYSFVKKSAGGLTLHNLPRAMTEFKNQQDGTLTDIAERDIFRERTDGTGTYNQFRKSVGEAPVTSFMELTGGDAALAAEIEKVYEGDIEKVDAGIGILAEPKPAGFALGFTQFYQFVLNAPRRVKSNRHLTEYYTLKDYRPEGMDWIEHSGGMLGVMARHLKDLPQGPAVVAAMEGVTRAFAPWPDAEHFPLRALEASAAASAKVLKGDLRTLGLGAAAAAAAVLTGAAAWTTGLGLVAALAVPLVLFPKRMLAWRFLQKAWQSMNTDRRTQMFPTLYLGEKWARTAAFRGRLASLATVGAAGWLAWGLFAAHPVVAALTAVVGLSALLNRGAAAAWLADMTIAKTAIQGRLRVGVPVTTDAEHLPGHTALEKRYWFLKAAGSEPVAKLGTTYLALKEHGLSAPKAFMTALLSHLLFGPKTQRGLGLKGRWQKGLFFKPFDIYLPNLAQAQGYSNTRIFAGVGNAKGLTPGEVDLAEFERMFDVFAPGRDYMTAYDFARMREGNRWRDADEGRGNSVSRFLGLLAAKRRAEQLVELYADRVVEEDKKLVPAVSKDMLLRVYKGTAQEDIRRERALDGVHPDLARPVPFR